jgi:microcystin-dependent protein
MTFREPKTWKGAVRPTDLNREVRDQFRALRAALTALEAGGGGPSTGILPLGYIMGFAGANVPTGWFVCDGQLVSKGDYADLYDLLLTAYGADTATTFAVPDLRQRFLRGVSSPGDGTFSSRGGTGGYVSNVETLTIASTIVSGGIASTSNDGGSHSHSYNTQHSHNWNHSSNAWSRQLDHNHGNNDHAHGGGTTSSGGGNSGTGNLGTTSPHGHGINNSNSTVHGLVGHAHSGDIGNVNVTSTTVGHSSATSTGTGGAHSHTSNHGHNLAHSHGVADKLPEYDDVNWLINYQTDAPEDWFIAGEAILGTSMIGA